jgi:phosphoribosylglycinamide formyltransferase 1
MKIVILTSNEIRHQYFRKRIALDNRIQVLASFCETAVEKSSRNTPQIRDNMSIVDWHSQGRVNSEEEFFADFVNLTEDKSNPVVISRGAINDPVVVEEIKNLDADLLVCYGSSLIRSQLLSVFKNQFLNVHLGLSPYYRGSGTNVWPLINREPEMVGATFMHMGEGIDTGEIIHQIRGDFFIGDSPHSIGNRLIKKMTLTCSDIIASFNALTHEAQPTFEGKLYFVKDFDENACLSLYRNFELGMINQYIQKLSTTALPGIVLNKGLVSA